MNADPGMIESYSSVKMVHGTLEEPPGTFLAHPGGSEVAAGTLEAHPTTVKLTLESVGTSTAIIVRYHCGGWSEEVNSCILISYMVYL